MIIKNYNNLLKNAKGKNKIARKHALQLIDEGINSILPRDVIRRYISLKNGILNIREKKFDLRKYKRIFVIGGGKASGLMAEEIEKILGRRITGGAVNDHIGQRKTKIVKITRAGHPIPNENGAKGVKRMLDLVKDLDKDDLVIALISGGGSALMTAPVEDISLQDLQKTNDLMLKSGAKIQEFNCVRKHISQIKGGGLIRHIYPATCVSLIFSDVVGDDLTAIASGCTVADPTRYKDALKIIKRYKVKVPKRVLRHLLEGARKKIRETPKPGDKVFRKADNILLANLPTALDAVRDKAKKLGLKPKIKTAKLEGEARVIGKKLAGLAVKQRTGTVLIYGGETTVTVKGKGLGGRNQELCLAASDVLKGTQGIAVISAGSDGRDGPTDAAGAIVDGGSYRGYGKKYLDNNDAYHFFKKTGDLLFTGATGTNVADLMLVVRV